MADNETNMILVNVDQMTPIDLFTSENIQEIIHRVEAIALASPQDTTTGPGRKAIASMAYGVARTKTTIDAIGKDYIAEESNRIKAFNRQRKILRDSMDAIRDQVRKPLDEWEKEEERKIKAAKLEYEIEQAWEPAHEDNRQRDELKARETEVARREAELAAKEEVIKAAENARQARIAEEERALREERMKAEAADQARQAEIQRQKDEQERIEQERKNREADQRHHEQVLTDVLNDVLALTQNAPLTEDVVNGIDNNLIRHVSIQY